MSHFIHEGVGMSIAQAYTVIAKETRVSDTVKITYTESEVASSSWFKQYKDVDRFVLQHVWHVLRIGNDCFDHACVVLETEVGQHWAQRYLQQLNDFR
jgi:hypothetical protein